jgi:hypothetical protein
MTESTGEVLAIYPTRESAEAAARRARDLGVPDGRILIGDPNDQIEALRLEMEDELEETLPLPGTALIPERAAKGAGITIGIATLIGAVLLAPFGLINWGTMGVGGRVLVAALIGAVAGATAGYIGAALAVKPDQPMDAERGVILRVESDAPEVIEALKAEGPIRIDVERRQASERTGEILDDDDNSVTGVVKDITENLRNPEGEWRR